MGKSILVFISHSSEDKELLIEPIVNDLEECYINVWIDKRNILPGDNLRKSVFGDGLDKADIVLIFFTAKSLKSSWVDEEIRHVLQDESRKGNELTLKKIISIFDTQETYNLISERYSELKDDLFHLMPLEYSKIHLGQLISAIWSKYLSLQDGDIEVQKQILAKDREIFQKDKDIQDLKIKLADLKSKNSNSSLFEEFKIIKESGKIAKLIEDHSKLINSAYISKQDVPNLTEVIAFGLVQHHGSGFVSLTQKGKDFFKWQFLNN